MVTLCQSEQEQNLLHHCKCGELIHLRYSYCSKCASNFNIDNTTGEKEFKRRIINKYNDFDHRQKRAISFRRKIHACGNFLEISTSINKKYKNLIQTPVLRYKTTQENYTRSNASISRTRSVLRRLLLCNISSVITDEKNSHKFITLTFRENVTNEECMDAFKKFIKRLNWEFYKTKKQIIKYVWIKEFQQPPYSRLHLHVILFDVPFLSNEKWSEIWHGDLTGVEGWIDAERLKINDNIRQGNSQFKFVNYLSKYLKKYLSGEQFDRKTIVECANDRAFSCSQNIVRPESIVCEDEFNDSIIDHYNLCASWELTSGMQNDVPGRIFGYYHIMERRC